MNKTPHDETRLANYAERPAPGPEPTKSQTTIATQAGFVNPNMITMIKQGRPKVAVKPVLRRLMSLQGLLPDGSRLSKPAGKSKGK